NGKAGVGVACDRRPVARWRCWSARAAVARAAGRARWRTSEFTYAAEVLSKRRSSPGYGQYPRQRTAKLDPRDTSRAIARTAPKAIDRAMVDGPCKIVATASVPALTHLTLNLVQRPQLLLMLLYP